MRPHAVLHTVTVCRSHAAALWRATLMAQRVNERGGISQIQSRSASDGLPEWREPPPQRPHSRTTPQHTQHHPASRSARNLDG